MLKPIKLKSTLILWTLSISLLCSGGCATRRPQRFLLPDGYIGWIEVEYKVKNAPKLPIEDSYYLLEFPPDGYLQTSSEPETGFAKDEFYYVKDGKRFKLKDGEGGMVWGGSIGQSSHVVGYEDGTEKVSGEKTSMRYFIGPESLSTITNSERIGPLNPNRPRQVQKFPYQDLSKQNLIGQNLSGVILEGTDLTKAQLRKTNLSFAVILHSDFTGADLRDANLKEADLRMPIFVNADLRGADLSKSWIVAADFTGANLTGCNFNEANYDIYTKWPKGFKPEEHGAIFNKRLG